MMFEFFNNTVNGIQEKINAEPDKTNARKKYAVEIAKLGSRLYSNSKKEKIAWCGVAAPFDILTAMGITSCFVEFIGAVLASTGTADIYINEAEQDGYAIDSCAYHRSVMGAMKKISCQFRTLSLGQPVLVLQDLALLKIWQKYLKKIFLF